MPARSLLSLPLQLVACRYPCSSDAEGAQVSRHTELHGNLKLGSHVLSRLRTFPVQLMPKRNVRAGRSESHAQEAMFERDMRLFF